MQHLPERIILLKLKMKKYKNASHYLCFKEFQKNSAENKMYLLRRIVFYKNNLLLKF